MSKYFNYLKRGLFTGVFFSFYVFSLSINAEETPPSEKVNKISIDQKSKTISVTFQNDKEKQTAKAQILDNESKIKMTISSTLISSIQSPEPAPKETSSDSGPDSKPENKDTSQNNSPATTEEAQLKYKLSFDILISARSNEIKGKYPCKTEDGYELKTMSLRYVQRPEKKYQISFCGKKAAWKTIPRGNVISTTDEEGISRDPLLDAVKQAVVEMLGDLFPLEYRLEARSFLYHNFPGGL
ncbi:MAG: hypothetical protein R3A80_01060 [Bdellovibrionota bacterium]